MLIQFAPKVALWSLASKPEEILWNIPLSKPPTGSAQAAETRTASPLSLSEAPLPSLPNTPSPGFFWAFSLFDYLFLLL